MIKAVIFDMGGVVHTVKGSPEQHLAFARDTISYLAEYGVRVDDAPEEFARELHRADRLRRVHNEETLREMPPLEAWCDFYLKKYGATQEQIFPIADELCLRWSRDRGEDSPRTGLLECLAGLREQGMRLGIISNTLSRTYAPTKLSEYGASKYFEYVLLSSVCGLRKPSADIFDLCQRSMDLEKHELAYVGDTISRDVIGVRNAGWALMIRISHPQARPETQERERKLEDTGYAPDYNINELPEVVDIIRSYNLAL